MSREFSAFKFETREAAKADTSRSQTESLKKQIEDAQKLAEEARRESAELKNLLEGTRKNLKSRADAAYSLAEGAQAKAADAQKRAEHSHAKAEQASSKAEQSTYKAEQADTKVDKFRADYARAGNELNCTGEYLREQMDHLVNQARLGMQASGVPMPAIEPPPPRTKTAEAAGANESSSKVENPTAPPRRRRFSNDIQLLPVGFPSSKPVPATSVALSKGAAAAGEREATTGGAGVSKGGVGGPEGFSSNDIAVADVRDRVTKLEHEFLKWKDGIQNELLAKVFNYPKRIEQGIKAVAASVLELQEEVERLSIESSSRPMPVVV
ncbi:hypothetical protein HDU87_007841 [Geranomyces variabilis]|uniref:Uncharacterized protein n=1 Tax=Geranomyces variabilis TaxID=109894 RepID=A0AAD5XJE6_9FUNG|nr:hypothetical protein HDU87_007841 [Geranomyces variabilis]